MWRKGKPFLLAHFTGDNVGRKLAVKLPVRDLRGIGPWGQNECLKRAGILGRGARKGDVGMNALKFGAEQKISGEETAVDAGTKVQELKAAIVALAETYSQGEIGQQEFSATMKDLSAWLCADEQAVRILAVAEAEAAQASAEATARVNEQITSQLQYLERKEQPAAATAKSGLADQAEREAMALQHEVAMLEHEQRELNQSTAVRLQYSSAVNAELAALEASERERLQQAGVVTQETVAEIRAREATERQTAALRAEIAALEAGEREALQYANAMFAADGAMEAFTVVASAAAAAQGRLNSAAGATRGGMGSLQQPMTAGSYAFRNFTATSGDLGAKLNSISNNLPTLLIGLGGLGTVISVAATAGIALYRNWESIASFWETRNPFPKGADDVAGLKRELDRAKDSTEKLEKAGTGTTRQLEEYDRLRAEPARLEKELADAPERQNRLKELHEAPIEEQKGRAKAFAEATKKGTSFESQQTDADRRDIEGELESARVSMELHIQTIMPSNALETDKQAQVFGGRKKYEDTVKLLPNPANDFANLAEDQYVRPARGEEPAFTALERLNEQTGGVFDAMLLAVRNMNPKLKKKVDADVDRTMKELEATEKGLTDHEKQRIRMWWDDFDQNIKDLSKENKAAGKKAKKTDDDEIDTWAEEGEDILKEQEPRQKAEAGRIIGAVGKDAAKERIAEQVSANPEADPEQIAVKVAAALAQAFEKMGATRGGANVTAQHLVGNAGFRVTPQQLFTARQSVAQRSIARARPKPGKKPAPKPRPRPVAKPKPAPIVSPTGRHVPREVREQAEKLQAQQAGKQASVLPAVQGTQTAVAATQAAVAAEQARIAKLETNVAQLLRDASRLRARATEQAPTALNSGSRSA